mmetsp:Transcript_24294/g.75228  ORF Transcript_24294/g.75228 Transcript_24294/m.75228 type:complete len:253 (-) Transcript_24294:1750-2508(-)
MSSSSNAGRRFCCGAGRISTGLFWSSGSLRAISPESPSARHDFKMQMMTTTTMSATMPPTALPTSVARNSSSAEARSTVAVSSCFSSNTSRRRTAPHPSGHTFVMLHHTSTVTIPSPFSSGPPADPVASTTPSLPLSIVDDTRSTSVAKTPPTRMSWQLSKLVPVTLNSVPPSTTPTFGCTSVSVGKLTDAVVTRPCDAGSAHRRGMSMPHWNVPTYASSIALYAIGFASVDDASDERGGYMRFTRPFGEHG